MEFWTVVLIFSFLIVLWLIMQFFAKPIVCINRERKGHLWKNRFDHEENILYCNLIKLILILISTNFHDL